MGSWPRMGADIEFHAPLKHGRDNLVRGGSRGCAAHVTRLTFAAGNTEQFAGKK